MFNFDKKMAIQNIVNEIELDMRDSTREIERVKEAFKEQDIDYEDLFFVAINTKNVSDLVTKGSVGKGKKLLGWDYEAYSGADVKKLRNNIGDSNLENYLIGATGEELEGPIEPDIDVFKILYGFKGKEINSKGDRFVKKALAVYDLNKLEELNPGISAQMDHVRTFKEPDKKQYALVAIVYLKYSI